MKDNPYDFEPEISFERIRFLSQGLFYSAALGAILLGSIPVLNYFGYDTQKNLITGESPSEVHDLVEEKSFPYAGAGAMLFGAVGIISLYRNRKTIEGKVN
ncbi:MAG: hypothetical protein Q8R18_06395 [bacterium]|nr:hypothetical protein [bacterium]